MFKKHRIAVLLTFILLFNLLIANGVLANPNPYETNIGKGLAFLSSLQNADAGFPWWAGEKKGESDPATTAWVVMALAANGEDLTAKKWQKNGQNPLDYLVKNTDQLESTTDYARQLLALATVNDYAPEKQAIINKLKSWQDESGHFGQRALDEAEFINAHMWTILALQSVGEDIANADKAKTWLINSQNDDGGFAWYLGLPSDADDTAIAIQTLIALGEEPAKSLTIKKALNYLRSLQATDGGFSSGWAVKVSNASTDSWVWQALNSIGETASSPMWTIKGKNVASHLISLQNQAGYFRWMTSEKNPSVTDTAYALIALSGKYMPISIDLPVEKDPLKKLKINFNKINLRLSV